MSFYIYNKNMLFPEGIVIDPIKRQYRTTKVNCAFSLIAIITRDNKRETKNEPSN